MNLLLIMLYFNSYRICRNINHIVRVKKKKKKTLLWLGIFSWGNEIHASVVESCHFSWYRIRAAPDNKVHGANMGPIWGRQVPGRPYVCPVNFDIWGHVICFGVYLCYFASGVKFIIKISHYQYWNFHWTDKTFAMYSFLHHGNSTLVIRYNCTELAPLLRYLNMHTWLFVVLPHPRLPWISLFCLWSLPLKNIIFLIPSMEFRDI